VTQIKILPQLRRKCGLSILTDLVIPECAIKLLSVSGEGFKENKAEKFHFSGDSPDGFLTVEYTLPDLKILLLSSQLVKKKHKRKNDGEP